MLIKPFDCGSAFAIPGKGYAIAEIRDRKRAIEAAELASERTRSRNSWKAHRFLLRLLKIAGEPTPFEMSKSRAVGGAVVHNVGCHEMTAVGFRNASRMDEGERARPVKLRKVRGRGMQPPVDIGGRRGFQRVAGAVAIGKDAQLRRTRGHEASIVGGTHEVEAIASPAHMDDNKNARLGFRRGRKSKLAQRSRFNR